MFKNKSDIRDICICILIIVSIQIDNRYFPDNLYAKVFIFGLSIYYFGGKIIRFIKKRMNRN